jgi:hypothetical protein
MHIIVESKIMANTEKCREKIVENMGEGVGVWIW